MEIDARIFASIDATISMEEKWRMRRVAFVTGVVAGGSGGGGGACCGGVRSSTFTRTLVAHLSLQT